MTLEYSLNDEEFQAVVELPGKSRYEHFIKRVADWEGLWSLKADSDWALGKDDKGREAVPVWPHSRYADACATGQWERLESAHIDLEAWLSSWVPDLVRDDKMVAVFPTPDSYGVVVAPQQIDHDLREESRQYE